ncbi:MAG: DUF2079 domain-containing protein [Anaerolineae bacterium]
MKSGSNRAYIALAILIALYIGTFGALASREHLAFETSAFDMGTYDQAIWNAAQGRGLAISLAPFIGPNRFAAHVEPILFLFVPLYWLKPSPLWLIWAQTLALGLAGWPLFLLARRRLGGEGPALVIVAAYFLLPATEAANLFDFHAVALSPPFTLAALYFLDRALVASGERGGLWRWPRPNLAPVEGDGGQASAAGRAYLWSAIFFLLALSTKEDISLHILMVGLYLILVIRRWKAGAVLALVGLAWFYIAFYLIIPANRSGAGETSAYVDFFRGLGDSPLAILLSPLRTPGKVLGLLLTPANIREWRMVLAPFGFAGLAGLPFLVMAAPTLAITMLSSSPLYQQIETWHYAAPMLPFLTLAAVDGLARLAHILSSGYERVIGKGRRTKDEGPRVARRVANLVHSPLSILTLLLLVSSLIYHYFRGYSPLARPFHWPEVTAHHALGEEMAALIPPQASVLAQAELVPRVSHRRRVAVWNGPFDPGFEYVFLDVAHPAFVNRENAQGELLTGMAIDPDFGLVASSDGYLLMRRNAPRLPTSQAFQSFLFPSPPGPALDPQAEVTFAGEIELVAVDTHWRRQAAEENVNEPQVLLTFRVLSQPAEDYRLVLYRLDEAGRLAGATQEQPPALVWWPTGRWQPGDVIQVRATPFWWTGDQRAFGYALGFVRGDAPWNEAVWDMAARLPVTAAGEAAFISPAERLALVAGFRRLFGIPYADERVKAQLAEVWGAGSR